MNPKIELLAGESLYSAIYKTQEYLEQKGLINGWIKFNGIYLLINANSVVDDIQLIYSLKVALYKHEEPDYIPSEIITN